MVSFEQLQFETKEQAQLARERLHNVIWPPVSSDSLCVEFSNAEKVWKRQIFKINFEFFLAQSSQNRGDQRRRAQRSGESKWNRRTGTDNRRGQPGLSKLFNYG